MFYWLREEVKIARTLLLFQTGISITAMQRVGSHNGRDSTVVAARIQECPTVCPNMTFKHSQGSNHL
jgi:hypothetical protein